MSRPPSPGGRHRSGLARAARRRRAFTLVELLTVLAIMSIIIAIAIPGITSLMESDKLNTAAHQVADQVNLARQLASSQNATVELRLFKPAGATTSGYTELQLGINNSSGTWQPAARVSILPPQMAISENTTLSSAFGAFTNAPYTSTNSGLTSGATYYPFEFKPSGIVTPVQSMTNYCFTVLPARYAAASYSSTLTSFKNYAVVQINPVTATPFIYRP